MKTIQAKAIRLIRIRQPEVFNKMSASDIGTFAAMIGMILKSGQVTREEISVSWAEPTEFYVQPKI